MRGTKRNAHNANRNGTQYARNGTRYRRNLVASAKRLNRRSDCSVNVSRQIGTLSDYLGRCSES